MTIHEMADKASQVCLEQGWDRGWSRGGCYLHLEVSEFIESLRGKGGSPPEEEAADVLFVLLSTCRGNKVDLDRVTEIFNRKCDALLTKSREEDAREFDRLADDLTPERLPEELDLGDTNDLT